MKYLAFDIEAANGYKPYSICSIGIAVADESFQAVEKFNIWVNPKTKYNLNGTRKNIGLNLNLDKDILDNAPDFAEVYEKVKRLLTDKDTIVLGHAVESDVLMLNAAIRHYKLEPIDFNFVCTQLLFKLFKKEQNVRGLDKIAAELGIEFLHHAAEEDAWVSLLTLKFLVQETGKNLSELLKEFTIRIGENKNSEMTRTVSLSDQCKKKKSTQIVVEKIKEKIASLKKLNHRKSTQVVKNVALSRGLECELGGSLDEILKAIVLAGFNYTPKISKCDVFVKMQDGDEDMRELYLCKLIMEGANINILTVAEFLEIATCQKK